MAPKIPNSIDELPTSSPRFIGRGVKRVEDTGLVTGRTEFIDNVNLTGMLHCAILRSPIAHAKIEKIDVSAALELPGVVAIVTGADAEKWSHPGASAPEGWGTHCLATDKVRFVGEPVAAVAATSRYLAEDALELIDVEYEPLEVVSDPAKAIQDGSPLVIEERGTNVMMHRVFNWGDVDAAFEAADHVFSEKFRWNRVGANPMETYGCICEWDPIELDMTVRGGFQSPTHMALGRATTFGLPSNKVRMIAHPHGGSFGGKGGPPGTDISLLLSRKAGGRPIKYIEDRMEYLAAGGSQAWDRHYELRIAVTADGIVTALDVKLVNDLGANGEGFGAINAAKPLAAFTGPYTIGAARYDLTLVATNKSPEHPYRGMGIDPADFRRRNFIPKDAFPYTIPSGNEYDSGDYEAVLDKVLTLSEYTKLRAEQKLAREQGRLVGIGVASAIEPGVFDWNAYAVVGVQGTGVPEGATVSIDILGKVTVRVGFALEGQGQYTLVTQLVADYFGIEMDDVSVTMLDTASAPPAFGPGGSRLGVAITGAVLGACDRIREKMCKVVAGLMQTEPENIQLLDGVFGIPGVTEAQMPMAQVAGTMLGASHLLPPDVDPRPEATHVWTAAGRTPVDEEGRAKSYLTAAQAVHIVQVEIDSETGMVDVQKYFLVDDCGTRLNPATVEGQTQGSVAQGIGAALLEEYVYDDDGNLLTSTYMDYLLPTISDVPALVMGEVVTPSPFTPLGAKGCGEGAIHTTPAAVMCAINDALVPLGTRANEVPAAPKRLWQLIREAGEHEPND